MRKNLGLHRILFAAILLVIVFIALLVYKVYFRDTLPKEAEHFVPKTPVTSASTPSTPAVPEQKDESSSDQTNRQNPVISGDKALQIPDSITIDNFWITNNSQGMRVIYGKAVNTSKRILARVEIQFELLNNEGIKVGTTKAYVTNLSSYATWEFETEIKEHGVTRAEIESVDTK